GDCRTTRTGGQHMESDAHRSTRAVVGSLGRAVLCLVWIAALSSVAVTPAAADPDPGVFDPHGNRDQVRSSFSATVSTNDQGVWIQITGQQQAPGQGGPPGGSQFGLPGTTSNVAYLPGTGGQPATGTVGASGQHWYDPSRGY